jgi:hypothetical protein
LIGALREYTANVRELPSKIIIFRDGVGDQMREQIIDKEVTQFKEAAKPMYNKAGDPPKITLVVVNKRIHQRMFIQSRHGGVENPPPGSIIDSSLVQNESDNYCFDFFLVPQ